MCSSNDMVQKDGTQKPPYYAVFWRKWEWHRESPKDVFHGSMSIYWRRGTINGLEGTVWLWRPCDKPLDWKAAKPWAWELRADGALLACGNCSFCAGAMSRLEKGAQILSRKSSLHICRILFPERTEDKDLREKQRLNSFSCAKELQTWYVSQSGWSGIKKRTTAALNRIFQVFIGKKD